MRGYEDEQNRPRMSTQKSNWENLFPKFQILENIKQNGFHEITATDFKSQNLEPRLLTKFDHSFQLPKIMQENSLSIIPINTSTWRIGPYKSFVDLPIKESSNEILIKKSIPSWLESLTIEMLTGEGAVLNAASASGIIEDFCETEMVSTISGKGRSGNFNFRINDSSGNSQEIEVTGTQIEIDGGFESRKSLHLFEVKKRYASDLNMRQLYFPLRVWASRVKKPVSTIYMTYVGNVYNIFEYEFSDLNDYSSGFLRKKQSYLLANELPTEFEVRKIAEESLNRHRGEDTSTPYPQADNIDRLFELLEFLSLQPRTPVEIAEEYEFDKRQSDYYFNALKFLGLARNAKASDGEPQRELSDLGQKIVNLPYKEKVLEIAKLMMSIKPVAKIYLDSLQTREFPGLEYAIREMTESKYVARLSQETLKRRAQTTISWARWLHGLPNSN